MKLHNMALLLGLALAAGGAQALQIKPLFELPSDQKQLTVEITNDSPQAHTYRVNLRALRQPYGNEPMSASGRPMLMPHPLNLSLGAGQSGVFTLNYQWGAEKEERYFRLSVTELESSASRALASGEKSAATATFGVSVSTLVLVRPRQLKFDYTLEQNVVRNTGNAAFWLMQDEDCGQKQGITRLVAPGKVFTMNRLSGKSVVHVGVQDQLKKVLNQCS